MQICPNHQEEYQVPTIMTFAFNGSERWCPYCGKHGGLFGFDEEVPDSVELENRYKMFREYSKEYLHAKGIEVCVKTTWNDEIIDPSKLPEEEKRRLKAIKNNYRHFIKIEERGLKQRPTSGVTVPTVPVVTQTATQIDNRGVAAS